VNSNFGLNNFERELSIHENLDFSNARVETQPYQAVDSRTSNQATEAKSTDNAVRDLIDEPPAYSDLTPSQSILNVEENGYSTEANLFITDTGLKFPIESVGHPAIQEASVLITAVKTTLTESIHVPFDKEAESLLDSAEASLKPKPVDDAYFKESSPILSVSEIEETSHLVALDSLQSHPPRETVTDVLNTVQTAKEEIRHDLESIKTEDSFKGKNKNN
jgi:hypothetical protein